MITQFLSRRPWPSSLKMILGALAALLLAATSACASEADLAIPDLHEGHFFTTLGGHQRDPAWSLLFAGAWVIVGTLSISLYLRAQIHRLPAHRSMLNVAEIIYQPAKPT